MSEKTLEDLAMLLTVLYIYSNGLDSGMIKSVTDESRKDFKRVIHAEIERIRAEINSRVLQ